MKKLTLTLSLVTTLSIFSISAFAVECSASKSYDNGRQYVTFDAPMTSVAGYKGKYEAEVEDAYYTFSKTDDGQYSAKIIMAPDYVNGLSTVANFDSNGRFSLAKISGSTTYIINCTK